MSQSTKPLPPAPAAATVRSSNLATGVAFVTGGARGLGNAIAVSFAREGARAVAIIDIQDEATFAEGKAAVEAFGTKVSTFITLFTQYGYNFPVANHRTRCEKCIAIHADVTKEADVERAVDKVVKEFGRIDYAAYVPCLSL
jgi:NAD(P)-dependent dehydrogenase (short-subunit alcohol dehydrogenase family)